jgi:hypothetical protein
MSDAPERIWAWKLNAPYSKYHGLKVWAPSQPKFKRPTVKVFDDAPWWKIWGRTSKEEPVNADMHIYVRADLIEELEAKLKTAEEIGRAFEEDAGQLREKLAKAVGALEFYRSAINLRIDCEITYAMQEAHDNAETFLAELNGEDRG